MSNDEAMGVPNGVKYGSISCKIQLKVDLPIYGQVYAQELICWFFGDFLEKRDFRASLNKRTQVVKSNL